MKKDDKELYDELVKFAGKNKIPNPKQNPIQFEFFVKSFFYYKERNQRAIVTT